MKKIFEKYGILLKSASIKVSFIFVALFITISLSFFMEQRSELSAKSNVTIESVQDTDNTTNETSVISQTPVVTETTTVIETQSETTSNTIPTSAEATRIAQEQSAAPISGISELQVQNNTTVATQTNANTVEDVVSTLNLQQVMEQSIEVTSESELLENIIHQILSGTQKVYYYYPGNYQANVYTKLLTYESAQNPIKDKEYALWMLEDANQINYFYTGSGGVAFSIIEINMVFQVTPDMESQVDAKVNQIIASSNTGTTAQKIKKVYDAVMNAVTYDDSLQNHTVYDALVNQSAVCDAYSLSMYRILSEMGIHCKFVASTNHAWNIVQIDGVWYNLDATWDDVSSKNYTYVWFLKSNAEFPYHTRAAGYTYPECVMSATSYLWQ